jgi:pyruvate dehydrogenase E1 component alpha subunit
VIDGNDVLVVHDAVARAAQRARAGDGPTILEARTYRHYGHSRTDPAKYRPEDEVAEWLARDPLTRTRAQLAERGVGDDQVDRADARAERLVTAAIEAAKAAPEADPAQAMTDVWADGSATWRT